MMRLTLCGTRGSLASPTRTARYGGNTSGVEVRGSDGTMLVLDAGTGIRRLARFVPSRPRRHPPHPPAHGPHPGAGFFAPLYRPDFDVHIWGAGQQPRWASRRACGATFRRRSSR